MQRPNHLRDAMPVARDHHMRLDTLFPLTLHPPIQIRQHHLPHRLPRPNPQILKALRRLPGELLRPRLRNRVHARRARLFERLELRWERRNPLVALGVAEAVLAEGEVFGEGDVGVGGVDGEAGGAGAEEG